MGAICCHPAVLPCRAQVEMKVTYEQSVQAQLIGICVSACLCSLMDLSAFPVYDTPSQCYVRRVCTHMYIQTVFSPLIFNALLASLLHIPPLLPPSASIPTPSYTSLPPPSLRIHPHSLLHIPLGLSPFTLPSMAASRFPSRSLWLCCMHLGCCLLHSRSMATSGGVGGTSVPCQ